MSRWIEYRQRPWWRKSNNLGSRVFAGKPASVTSLISFPQKSERKKAFAKIEQ